MTSPRFAREWPSLAAVARELLATRERGYPAAVAAGKLTQADADTGIAVMRALAEQWRRILDREPLPDLDDYAEQLGAANPAIVAALASAATRTAAIAKADPADARAGVYAECVAALLWQQRPRTDCGDPHIVFVHAINTAIRAERATASELLSAQAAA